MTISPSVTQEDIFTAVRAYILGLISCEVVRALDNGVPMPRGSFVAVTPLYSNRLSTNIDTYSDTVKTVESRMDYTIQIDCYGPESSDWAAVICSLWRDDYAVQAMAPSATPLYADDPKMMPAIDGESNFTERWMITATLQYNPAIRVPIQSTSTLSVVLIDADKTYPPH